jgi:hypothetical protein
VRLVAVLKPQSCRAIFSAMLRWGSRFGDIVRGKQSRGSFARQQLDRLRIGAELRELPYSGVVIALGPPGAAAAVDRSG